MEVFLEYFCFSRGFEGPPKRLKLKNVLKTCFDQPPAVDGTYLDVSCAVGVHQGCPFGTTLFCAALHVSISLVMTQHPDVEAAYADNIYLVASLTRAHDAFDALAVSMAKNMSLAVSTSQSYIYLPWHDEADWQDKRTTYDAHQT